MPEDGFLYWDINYAGRNRNRNAQRFTVKARSRRDAIATYARYSLQKGWRIDRSQLEVTGPWTEEPDQYLVRTGTGPSAQVTLRTAVHR